MPILDQLKNENQSYSYSSFLDYAAEKFHTNVSYDHDLDSASLGEFSLNKQLSASPGQMRRTSDQSKVGRNYGSYNMSRTSIDKKHQNDASSEQHAPTTKKNFEKIPEDDSYYSLKHLRESRRGERDEDSGLSRRVRRFYKDQDELIDVYERLYNLGEDGNENDEYEKQQESIQRMAMILTKVSLGVNICLFLIKIVAAAISKSLAVVSSVVDSAVDIFTSLILFWAWHVIEKRDKYRYPEGRTRLEPVAIIILSVIMCATSVLVIYESIATTVNDAQYFTETNTTKTLSEIDMSTSPIVVMVVTIVSKAILFVLCYRIKTPTMSALAADHRNDVASNIVALVCGLVGSYAYKSVINQKAIFIDPVGAIVISIYIIITWIRQANDQIKRLSGHTADPKFLSQITWLTYHHSQLIKKIDTVRAFYFGSSYMAEVNIVLPDDMTVREAHDIAESLQKKIEDLHEVERAFVHIDYECDHNPANEHKIV